jgi:hypothetical protein
MSFQAVGVATAGAFVCHIFGLRPELEMLRIPAGRIVAAVTHTPLAWFPVVGNLPRQTVYIFFLLLHPHLAVAFARPFPLPLIATASCNQRLLS